MREVIKTADWVIDLGPEGGDKGGEIVAEGTPEQVAKEARSYTGGYLKALLAKPASPTPNSAHPEPVEGLPFSSRTRRKRVREAAE